MAALPSASRAPCSLPASRRVHAQVGRVIRGRGETEHPLCELAAEIIGVVEAPSGPAAARRAAEVGAMSLGPPSVRRSASAAAGTIHTTTATTVSGSSRGTAAAAARAREVSRSLRALNAMAARLGIGGGEGQHSAAPRRNVPAAVMRLAEQEAMMMPPEPAAVARARSQGGGGGRGMLGR